MSALRWTAVLLLVVPGIIHIYYGAVDATTFGNIYGLSYTNWFYIMGLIYFVGAAIIAANIMPKVFEALAALYAAILIVIYILQDAGSSGAIGYADKAIEVLLIIVLLVLLVQKPKPKPTAQ